MVKIDKDKATPRKHGKADPVQYERFTEAARDAGCDENAERLDEVVRRAAKLPPPRREPSRPKRSKKTKE